ncbi:MAG: hypothetical protein B6I20_12435 [Bacteroidetes bacterium 4572_117]|nr:MAG: hypothetical protein B6I20_12435 [Bacteroidetes bacterium 4572_117]
MQKYYTYIIYSENLDRYYIGASLFAYSMGISINFGRIYRFLVEKGINFIDILEKLCIYLFDFVFLCFSSQNIGNRIKNKIQKTWLFS